MAKDVQFEFRLFPFSDTRAYVTYWLYRNTRSAIKAAKMMACDVPFEIWRTGQCIYRRPGGFRHSPPMAK